jgi:topoisomerase-4 subunit A
LAFLPEGADHLAVVGQNRKLIIFKLSELPEMSRGKGVRLQKYKDGGLSDLRAFKLKEGLTWTDSSGRLFTITDLAEWIGERAGTGRIVPKGFPRSNRFS